MAIKSSENYRSLHKTTDGAACADKVQKCLFRKRRSAFVYKYKYFWCSKFYLILSIFGVFHSSQSSPYEIKRFRGCLELPRSHFYSSALASYCQTHLAPRTPLRKKGGAGGQLHVFSRAPQGVLHQFQQFYSTFLHGNNLKREWSIGVCQTAHLPPQTPWWSCSMIELVEPS